MRRPPQLRLRGGTAVQRQLPPGGRRPGLRRAAAGSPPVARLERAEQPRVPAHAVQEGQGALGRPERGRLRQDLQRGLRRGASRRCCKARRSVAGSPLPAATTHRGRRGPRCRRWRSSARQARRDEALRRVRPPSLLRHARARRRRRSRRRRPRSAWATSTTWSRRSPASTARSGSGSPSTATRPSRRTGSSASPTRKQAALPRQAFAIARKNPRDRHDAVVPAPRPARARRAGSPA